MTKDPQFLSSRARISAQIWLIFFPTSVCQAASTSLLRDDGRELSKAHRTPSIQQGTLQPHSPNLRRTLGFSASPGSPDQTCLWRRHKAACLPWGGCTGNTPTSQGCDLPIMFWIKSTSRVETKMRTNGHIWEGGNREGEKSQRRTKDKSIISWAQTASHSRRCSSHGLLEPLSFRIPEQWKPGSPKSENHRTPES